MKIPMLAGRAFELLCAAVVLGLSASLYPKFQFLEKYCEQNCSVLDGWKPSIGYCAFVGAWGIVDAFLGLAAEFVDAIPFFIISGVDSFAIVAFLAGGVRMAVLLGRAVSCDGDMFCTQLQADTAFLFLGFVATAPLLVMGFMRQRRGGKNVGV